MATGHATAEMLTSFVAGGVCTGLSVLIAGHLWLCPRCAEKVKKIEALCGALLAECDGFGCDPPDLKRVLPRISSDRPEKSNADLSSLNLGTMEAVIWTHTAPGWLERPVESCPTIRLQLGRGEPSATLPRCPPEPRACLVLRGQVQIGEDIYTSGSLILRSPNEIEPIIAHGADPCLLLLLRNEDRLAGSNLATVKAGT